MVFVSVVSPTTTVCGSFVGAVGGGGGGAASSVVLQSIVSRGIIFSFLCSSYSGAFEFDRVKTHSMLWATRKLRYTGTRYRYTGTDGGIKSNEYTCMSCIKQDTGISQLL